MILSTMNKGLLAAFAASALAIVGALLLVSSAAANPATVVLTADPSSIAPGGTTTVHVTVNPASGELVGHVTANLTYDETQLTATACTPVATCNTAPPAPHTVAVAVTSASGLSGDQATFTFTAKAGFTGSSTVTGTVPDCETILTAALTCPVTPVTITVAVATASPTPSPTASGSASGSATATAAPTATVKTLPTTGGPLGDSSSISLAWLLGAAGLFVVAGGAWTLARARREEN
jgi:hypothetical protein